MRATKGNLRLIAVIASVFATLVAGAQAAQSKISDAYTTKGAWSFVSAPNLHPPKLSTNGRINFRKLAHGYFMVVNSKNLAFTRPMVGEGGPLILDNHLQPVWFNPLCVRGCSHQNLFSFNLNEQSYLGKPVLSWWQGSLNKVGDPTTGTDVVVDQHYRTVAKLIATGGWVASQHQFLISGPNAWVTVYRTVSMDLRPYGGPQHGQLLDSGVQEYNLKTGQLLYTWDALAHIPLTDSYQKPSSSAPWDAYHVNSIGLPTSTTFLVSMRNTWAAYLVNRATSVPEWSLGGKHSSFTFGSKAAFRWQHDVQLLPNGEVTMFDDHCCQFNGKNPVLTGPPRGLVLKLDVLHHKATFVAQYVHNKIKGKPLYVAFLGGTQLQPNGNVVVGWGSQPFISEFSKKGRTLLDAFFPIPDQTGWAWLQHWVATPFYPPSGAARRTNGQTKVYASWNGATQVASWRVVGGSNAKHLKAIRRVRKNGFETTISITGSYKMFEIEALDGKGKVIGTSKTFSLPKSGKTPSPGFY